MLSKCLIISPFCSATVNPVPLSLPTVVPYAHTPTGQGVDCLVFGGIVGFAEKGTVSAKANTPLFDRQLYHQRPLH